MLPLSIGPYADNVEGYLRVTHNTAHMYSSSEISIMLGVGNFNKSKRACANPAKKMNINKEVL